MRNEEELGIKHTEVSVECIGLVADLVVNTYEFIFIGRTSCSAADILSRARHAKDADEHVAIEAFPWSPAFVRELVCLPDPRAFVPTGFAGVALALRHDFGPAAFLVESADVSLRGIYGQATASGASEDLARPIIDLYTREYRNGSRVYFYWCDFFTNSR